MSFDLWLILSHTYATFTWVRFLLVNPPTCTGSSWHIWRKLFYCTALILCLLGLALIWLVFSSVSTLTRKWLKYRKRIIEPTSGSQPSSASDGKNVPQHQSPQRCRLKSLDTFRGYVYPLICITQDICFRTYSYPLILYLIMPVKRIPHHQL